MPAAANKCCNSCMNGMPITRLRDHVFFVAPGRLAKIVQREGHSGIS